MTALVVSRHPAEREVQRSLATSRDPVQGISHLRSPRGRIGLTRQQDSETRYPASSARATTTRGTARTAVRDVVVTTLQGIVVLLSASYAMSLVTWQEIARADRARAVARADLPQEVAVVTAKAAAVVRPRIAVGMELVGEQSSQVS